MKPLSCSFGFHDWEIVETSTEYGFMFGQGPAKRSDYPVAKAAVGFDGVSDLVCLKCGKCKYNIQQWKEQYEQNKVIEECRRIEEEKRKALAKDLYSLCNKENK